MPRQHARTRLGKGPTSRAGKARRMLPSCLPPVLPLHAWSMIRASAQAATFFNSTLSDCLHRNIQQCAPRRCCSSQCQLCWLRQLQQCPRILNHHHLRSKHHIVRHGAPSPTPSFATSGARQQTLDLSLPSILFHITSTVTMSLFDSTLATLRTPQVSPMLPTLSSSTYGSSPTIGSISECRKT